MRINYGRGSRACSDPIDHELRIHSRFIMNGVVSHRSSPILYSIGHGDRSIEDFVSILLAHGIRGLADVRDYPVSRRHPQFSREELRHALEERGIKYLWLGASLGGFRSPHLDARHRAWSSPALRAFADLLASS